MKPFIKGLHRARFAVWVVALRLRLRRYGCRLALNAPHGARFRTAPDIEVEPGGDGSATFTLTLGRDVDLGRHTTIEIDSRADSSLELGDLVYLMSGVRLQLRGGSISIGPMSSLRDGVVLKSDGVLRIGARVPISYGAVVHCHELIEFEDLVGIGEHVSILDSHHVADGGDVYHQDRPLVVAPVLLERNSLVLANAVILHGVRLGRNAVVGAGAVVRSGEYPASHLIAGVPAKVVGPLGAADHQT